MLSNPSDNPSENPLNCDTILQAEFNYIAETISQNREDRASTTTFYLAAIGSFVAAILSEDSFNSEQDYVYRAFVGLFFLLGLIGVRTLMQLSQLRKAWFDSVLAMNSIKQYYLNQHLKPDLEKAFRWSLITQPDGFQKLSISSLLAYQTASLASGCFGVCAYFITHHHQWHWAKIPALVFIATFTIQIVVYILLLRDVKEEWNEVKKKLCPPNPNSST